MGKSVVTIVMMMLVVGLVGPGLAQDGDPNLVGWWKFDGDGLDASGNGRNGTLMGEAEFVPGLSGQALALGGSPDYFNVDGYQGILGGHAFSISAWVTSTGSGDRTIVNWGSSTNGQRVDFRLYQGRLRVEHGNGNLQADTALNDGLWRHVALVVNEGASIGYPDCVLYLDGENDSRTTTDPDTFNITASVDVSIGRRATHDNRYYPGLIDEVRIYDKALTAEEVKALAAHPKAYNPTPPDGTLGVTNPLLSWAPRETALFHDIYLGTSPDLGPDDLVAPRSMAALYWHVPGLEPGTTYYWKVDEIDPDETVHPGDVWSFMFCPFEAWQAVPADAGLFVDPNATLTWTTGLSGISHDVYFGADETQVAEGTGDTFKGNTLDATYVTGDLELDTTYYWRIDEVDAAGTNIKGNVWSFTTVPEIPVADPSLVAWYTMDEGVGTRAVDWSGHGHHGTLNGGPQWVDGYESTALSFAADDVYVEAVGYPGVTGTDPRTLCAWIKTSVANTNMNIMSWGENVTGQKWRMRTNDTGTLRIEVNGGFHYGVTNLADDQWHHVAVTFEDDGSPDVLDTLLYVDGLLDGTAGSQATDVNTASTGAVRIGESPWHNSPFFGLIDDARIYDRVLTEEEIVLVMRIDLLRSWQPSPADGAVTDAPKASPLTWQPGDAAAQHDVYLGTDGATVAAADTTDASGIYRGRVNVASHVPAPALEWGQTYFWRIDEINNDGSVTTGRVWSFTVVDYLIVEDFERYTDNEDAGETIYQTWIDGWENGTGSVVGNLVAPFAEQSIVYSGVQSMPLEYNNINTPWYSEAERTWDVPQDWTFNDVNTLVLHIQGAPVDFIETAPGSVTMSAAGTDIWNLADECRFAYKRLNGDGSILARVDSIANSHVWAKGGVMIRESLDPGSRFAMVVVTPGSGVAFQRRLANGIDAIGTTESGILAPHWVKLTRTGNELTAQHSADGVTWGDVIHATNPTSDTVVMGGTLYIGLALTSHSEGNVTTAEFSGIEMAGNVTGPWQVAEIGVDHPGNSPDSLYVAVEDAAGRIAVAPHPDPGAVLYDSWRPWPLDLADLSATGVNLRAVKTMYIGVGDRDNPQPDGAGRIYIDDIRITQGVPVEPNDVEVVE